MTFKNIDNILHKFFSQISAKLKVTFFSTFAIGIITHLYMLNNKLLNPDDTRHMFTLGVGTPGGRFGLDLLQADFFGVDNSIFYAYSMPWINGILSILFIAFTACIVVAVLNIKSNVLCAVLGGVMVTFPTVAATFHYMFTAPAYFLSLLLSALAVYLASKQKSYYSMASVVLLALVLSIYQAYFWFAIALFMLKLLFDILDNIQHDFRYYFMAALKYVGILVGGLAAYYLLNKIALWICGVQMVNYGGLNDMFNISFLEILEYSKLSFTKFFTNTYAFVEKGQAYRFLLMVGIGVLATIQFLFVAYKTRKNRTAPLTVLLGLILVCFPLGAGSIYIASRQFVHSLMIYPSVAMFILIIGFIDRFDTINTVSFQENAPAPKKYKAKVTLLTSALLGLIILNFIAITNAVYLGSQITTTQTLSYINRLTTRIEMVDEFDIHSMQVAFIGDPNSVKNPAALSELYSLNNLTGVSFENNNFTQTEENVLLTISANTVLQQIERYAGYKMNFASAQLRQKLEENEQVKNMPVYPKDGSLKVIDDILVVKFIETNPPA